MGANPSSKQKRNQTQNQLQKETPQNKGPVSIIEDPLKVSFKKAGIHNDLILFCNDKELDPNANVNTIIPKNKFSDLTITYQVKGGLSDFPINYENEVDLVGKPLSNPFEILAYRKSDNTFSSIDFPEEKISQLELDNYSRLSAYCNGNNHLFISGGKDANGTLIGHFWDIDLSNNDGKKYDNAISPKKMHSMLYVPNSYVFIVGGSNRKTYYYDMKENSFKSWRNLNKDRYEPALALISNRYIYVFSNLKDEDPDMPLTFERTDLRTIPHWESIKVKFEASLNPNDFKQKFFGVCDYDNNSNEVIFLCGDMDLKEGRLTSNEEYCFKYNPNDNTISRTGCKFKGFDLTEKTFLPYDRNNSLIIPHFNRGQAKIILYNKNVNKVTPINFFPENDTQEEIINFMDNNIYQSFHLLPRENIILKKAQKKKFNFNIPKIRVNNNADLELKYNNINTIEELQELKPKVDNTPKGKILISTLIRTLKSFNLPSVSREIVPKMNKISIATDFNGDVNSLKASSINVGFDGRKNFSKI